MKVTIFQYGILLFAFLIVNCGNSDEERIKGEVSLCDGFRGLAKNAITKPSLSIDSASYCTAERLLWEYDTMTSIVRLLHTRQTRNCAAELSVEASVKDNSITVIENDNRDPNGGADCACTFDTYVEVPNITSESIIVNYPKKSLVLQLTDLSGSIILDSMQSEGCRH